MSWIAKQRYQIDFTLSSLLRRKGKNLSLLLVYTTVVFFLASALLFTESLEREAALILEKSPDIVVQRLAAGRHDLIPAVYTEQIRGIAGVKNVEPRLWGYYFDSVFQANYTLMVPREDPPPPGEIIIGPGVSLVSESDVDNILPFWKQNGKMTSYIIAGLIEADSQLVAADLILIGESDFRDLFDQPGHLATDLRVDVYNPREISTIAKKIRERLPDTRPVIRAEMIRTYEAVFGWRSGLLIALLTGAVLAFVIFAWDKASGLSAEEKKEIGVLKAVGWETGEILQIKFWEGMVISLSAFLIGCILAYIHVFFGSSLIFMPVLKGWSVLYPEFRLIPFFDPLKIASLFFFTVVPYTVATIIPSWRAATLDPDLVLRS